VTAAYARDVSCTWGAISAGLPASPLVVSSWIVAPEPRSTTGAGTARRPDGPDRPALTDKVVARSYARRPPPAAEARRRHGAARFGVYIAKWVVTDANGDTRTVRTRFVEQG
jgi:hypothetical protein